MTKTCFCNYMVNVEHFCKNVMVVTHKNSTEPVSQKFFDYFNQLIFITHLSALGEKELLSILFVGNSAKPFFTKSSIMCEKSFFVFVSAEDHLKNLTCSRKNLNDGDFNNKTVPNCFDAHLNPFFSKLPTEICPTYLQNENSEISVRWKLNGVLFSKAPCYWSPLMLRTFAKF